MDDTTMDDDATAPLVVPRSDTHARLTLVAHPDLGRVGASLAVLPGELVEVSRLGPEFDDGLPLADRTVSRTPLTFGSTAAGVVIEGGAWRFDDGSAPMTLWRGDYTEYPSVGRVDRGIVLWAGSRVALLLERGERVGPTWFGRSVAAGRVAARVERLASLKTPVLVRGPSGAGKELVARTLHDHGPRARRPFVSVNMASIPSTTAASSLFGHIRGAFTGADSASAGLFGSADQGTLFLDEIGATPLEVQDLLLRAVELGEVLPVGARGPRQMDVRVVAATDADLEAAMAAGRFRAPLYYRLAAHPVDVPPLAARRADIAPLFVGAWLRAQQELGLEAPAALSPQVLVNLLARPLVGNVRELRALASRHALGDALPAPVVERASAEQPATAFAAPLDADRVRAALDASDGVLARAARVLGVSNAALHQFLGKTAVARRARDLAPDELAAALDGYGDVASAAKALGVSVRGLQLRLAREGSAS